MSRFVIPIFIILSLTLSICAQMVVENKEAPERARALVEAATKALGGQAYLSVKTEHSRGYLTPYRENSPEKLALQTFVDYIVLPDKERVEFKGQGRRFIQSNMGAQGWFYDSDSQQLREQTEAQRQRFIRGLRFQVDQILRGGWSAPGVKLGYLPRQEIWPRQFADGIQLTYPDAEEVSIFFDSQTSLPLALRFPRVNEKGERINAENRFFKYIELKGIKSPHVVDLFENGVQIMRLNYEQREFNVSIPEKIFTKPENPKELK
jgi:hypothetical protein